MGFEEIVLTPGFDIERTPTLLKAGYTDGGLIRWKEGLPEKLGGWSRFYPFSIGSIPRALLPWQDLNQNQRLAVGATGGLKVITNGVLTDISPQEAVTSGVPNISSTNGSNIFTINDPNLSNATTNDFVFLHDQVFVGGVILFGMYAINTVLGPNQYTILGAQNATGTAAQLSPPAAPTTGTTPGGALGATTYFVKVTYVNPSGETVASAESTQAAGANTLLTVTSPIASGTATQYNVYVSNTAGGGSGAETLQTPTPINLGTNWTEPTTGLVVGVAPPVVNSTGGSLPKFTTTSGSATVNVALTGHGLVAGQTAFFLDPTTFNNVTINGSYQVIAPVTANNYNIQAMTQATASGQSFQNGGNLVIVYFLVQGPQQNSSGWGVGTWGTGGWGTGPPITPTDWSLLNFGEILIANPATFPLFQWPPESGFLQAVVIKNGPVTADGILLAQPQQIIVAWGVSFNGFTNPMRVAWCDAGDFTNWTPTAINFAGGFTIPSGSRIVGGLASANQFSLWTDIGLWSGQFVGQPLVFSIIEVMKGCGLVGRKAMGTQGSTNYWMSQNQPFQQPIGGTPSVMPCPIWDKVFQRIDKTNFANVRFFSNSHFHEIGWFYPVVGGNGENTEYIKFDTVDGEWDYGPIGRSAWYDNSILGPPVAGVSSPANL